MQSEQLDNPHEVVTRATPHGVDDVVGALIVGAQKSGTTSLARALAAHPDVHLAAGKEAHLFDDPEVQRTGLTRARLARAFPGARKGAVLLDATPSYLYLPGCLDALARHNTNARIVVIVRDPAQRAISQYYHSQRNQREARSIGAALILEGIRLWRDPDPLSPDSAHRWSSYQSRSRYKHQVERALDLFGSVLLIRLEGLTEHPGQTLKAVQEYIGVKTLDLGEHVGHHNSHGRYARHNIARGLLNWSLEGERRWLRSQVPGITRVLEKTR